ncbi:MAG TPA: hypothetical protein DEQ87_03965 [Algoriphagus sp.]|nr:hypothetical protein [Algoriphagus sp.]MAN88660.1 hypothetical protein [Algoriphagus sp.]HAD52819.1 hypothetical protein [Algoriphagus sp.]HAH38633.1 hypothetical protein [Algoriphagus sp.]HAS59298.1 hypothetical protein [Algoriphagus sp.]
MLEAILFLIIMLWALALLGLILGLIRPVIVLWFLDRFNRLKVLKIYGIPFLILSLLLFLFRA